MAYTPSGFTRLESVTAQYVQWLRASAEAGLLIDVDDFAAFATSLP